MPLKNLLWKRDASLHKERAREVLTSRSDPAPLELAASLLGLLKHSVLFSSFFFEKEKKTH